MTLSRFRTQNLTKKKRFFNRLLLQKWSKKPTVYCQSRLAEKRDWTTTAQNLPVCCVVTAFAYFCVDNPQNDSGEKIKQQQKAKRSPDGWHWTAKKLPVRDVILRVRDVTVIPNSSVRRYRQSCPINSCIKTQTHDGRALHNFIETKFFSSHYGFKKSTQNDYTRINAK